MKRLLVAFFVFGVGAAAVLAAWLLYTLNAPYAAFGAETFVELPRGTGAREIARRLAGAGVIRSEWPFLAARLVRRGRILQAGEYRFDKPATPLEVYDRIARGDIFHYELVVPEGKNMFDIGALAEELGLFTAADFLKAARNPAMIRDLAPEAPSLEGYLFPSTYYLPRHTSPERLCRMMTAKFRETWKSLRTDAGVHRTVTLASLVEKEGKVPAERPLIAAVFLRRLELGMRMDCDPTVIYAALLEGAWRGTIYRSDLDRDHPYNTYRRVGLPPGAIANPGAKSLEAVLHPADTDALYFVARPDGSGAHTFSNDLAGQQKAVAEYRRGLSNNSH
ncbi:MAG TPA: endolytic transglycosylase MltG [Bryobacteraceae bacterium]|nr:endolytic transglycosylase MltG [Bryobacteraceae bacterium]